MNNAVYKTAFWLGCAFGLGFILVGPTFPIHAETPNAAPALPIGTRKLPASIGLGASAARASASAFPTLGGSSTPSAGSFSLGAMKPGPQSKAASKPMLVAQNQIPGQPLAAMSSDPLSNDLAKVPAAVVTAPTARQPLDKKQIRKLLTSEPDPSLVLEPVADPPPPPKPIVPKAPPRRPASALPANGIKLGIPGEAPAAAEVSVILMDKQFFPSKIKLKEGVQSRLYFTTTNDKAAALVIEELQIQRWVAKEGEKTAPLSELERAKMEATKEVSKDKITEIPLEPRRGTFIFHDLISGAKGQIVVE